MPRGKGLLTIRFTKFYIPFSLKRYLFRSPSIENTTRLLHDLSNKNESLKQEVSMSLRVTLINDNDIAIICKYLNERFLYKKSRGPPTS